MFTQTWKKYLAVIHLLLKRSLKEDQTLTMNSTDFHKASGGKKVKYNFSITVIRGRIENLEKAPHIGRDLVEVLMMDDKLRAFALKNVIEFSMSSGFLLSIKNVTPPDPAAEQPSGDETEVKTEEGDEESVNK
jgi:hypothetical protein